MVKSLLILSLLLAPADSTRLGLSISPRIATARNKIKASITIPPDDRNRVACLVWEGESEVGSHCWEHLDEGDFPPHIEYPIILHTIGTFEFQLVLQRTDKILRTPTVQIEVR